MMGTSCFFTVQNCGGSFYDSTGVIESPNYPGLYDDRSLCAYFIKIAGAQQITFTFISFDTEEFKDILEGRIGATADSPYTMSWEGNLTMLGMTPKPFTVMTNSYVFYFSTDRNIPMKGFRIEYSSGKSADNFFAQTKGV